MVTLPARFSSLRLARALARPRAYCIAALFLLVGAAPGQAQNNPKLADDYSLIMGWLTGQVAQGLAFNAGSTFDPPNEMKRWRIQPDVSLALGVMPFDKSVFPRMTVVDLEAQNPSAILPDGIKFPNLTLHMRLGLPGRMDFGIRGVNMTVPKGYRLSDSTTGTGQSNTIGVSLRKHFLGGNVPLVSAALSYNHVLGYFSFKNTFEDLELTKDFIASSDNVGRLEWDVRSIGVNVVASQVFGRWTPFLGLGYNRVFGRVSGSLTSNWRTDLFPAYSGSATSRPEGANTRLISGFQLDGALLSLFLNMEFKISGAQSGKAYVLSLGLAAPFNIGKSASIVRYGRNKPADLAMREEKALKYEGRKWERRSVKSRDYRPQRGEDVESAPEAEPTEIKTREPMFWPAVRPRRPRRERAAAYDEKSELIFLR